MRRLSLSIAMLVGLTLLIWGGVSLQRIFAQERDEAVAALDLQQQSLHSYAADNVRRLLHETLKDAQARIDRAAASAFEVDTDLLLVSPGVQHLPRLVKPLAGTATPAKDLYEQLVSETLRSAASGPWAERVSLLLQLERAVKQGKDADIVSAVRNLLNHRSRFVVDSQKDIPHLVRFLEVFVTGASPDPSLMRAMLIDGLRGTEGPRLVGLAELLLLKRGRFTQPDFEFLRGKVIALSRLSGVRHARFTKLAMATPPSESIPIDLPLPGPFLVAGIWFAEPTDDGGARGVKVDVSKIKAQATQQMRAAGLLGPLDTLSVPKKSQPLDALSVDVTSPQWDKQRRAIRRRYRLKSALGVTLGGLAVVITLLVFVLNRRQRRYLKAKSDFVSAVSHELRTPLASLRVMGETLERRLADTPEAKDFPARIVREADRLGFMVENILSFNRLDRAQGHAHREEITLSELVEEMREATPAYTDKPVHMEMHGDDAVMRVDPDLMKLLFSNLTNNACKYNQRDAVEISITGTSNNGHGVTVAFSDNGTGVPADIREEIFTEFFRAQGSESRRGFGLGLAICRRIMQLHQGSIRIADSSDQGTTFELSLPKSEGSDAS